MKGLSHSIGSVDCSGAETLKNEPNGLGTIVMMRCGSVVESDLVVDTHPQIQHQENKRKGDPQ